MNLNGVKALPSGNVIDLKNPSEYTFTIKEIASLLAGVKRFNGLGISVASHSVWVARILYHLTGNPHIALRGLFHDAQEGYIGDLATPVKDLAGGEWDKLEHAINREILLQFKIKHKLNLGTMPLVKIVDTLVLYHELHDLIEQGVYKLDTQGVWEATFKGVKPFDSELSVCEQPNPAEAFEFFYTLYKQMCEQYEAYAYTEQTYIAKDGSHTCMVENQSLHVFQQALGGNDGSC